LVSPFISLIFVAKFAQADLWFVKALNAAAKWLYFTVCVFVAKWLERTFSGLSENHNSNFFSSSFFQFLSFPVLTKIFGRR